MTACIGGMKKVGGNRRTPQKKHAYGVYPPQSSYGYGKSRSNQRPQAPEVSAVLMSHAAQSISENSENKLSAIRFYQCRFVLVAYYYYHPSLPIVPLRRFIISLLQAGWKYKLKSSSSWTF